MLLHAGILISSDWTWESITSMRYINDMVRTDSTIWCGTEGGLFSYNSNSNQFHKYTNIDGLSSNYITALTIDGNQDIWIGMDNGIIQILNPATGSLTTINDYQSHQIYDLEALNDSIYVGLDIGLSLYIPARKEVKETYKRLGNQIQAEIPVVDVAIKGNELWVATPEGLAVTNLNYVNLLDPQSWKNDTSNFANTTALHIWKDTIWASGPNGLFQFDNETWKKIRGEGIIDIESNFDHLIVCSKNSIFEYDGTNWISVDPSISPINQILYFNSILWAGTERGLYRLDPNLDEWEDTTPNGIFSNLVTDVYVDIEGTIWATSRSEGIFCQKNEKWQLLDSNLLPGLTTHDYMDIQNDDENNVWFGTWGGGVKKISLLDSSWVAFSPFNGYLAGISGHPNYCVVHHMTKSQDGTLWLVNRESVTNLGLVAVSQDTIWTYYGIGDGINTIFLSDVTVDIYGRIWLGSDPLGANGVFVIDPAGTPHDKTDDPPIAKITRADGMETNHITALCADQDGGVWIGTPDGLYYFYNGFLERQYGLYSEYVTDIHIDGADNIWIGTVKGVAMLSKSNYEWTYLTTENSPLLSDDVGTIASDFNTGDVYICTSNGISKIQTPFAKPVDTLGDVLHIYPNPFNVHEISEVTIDQLTSDVTVDIFNSAGYLVRHFNNEDVAGRKINWDGRNEKGNFVASGVYLVVEYDENGKKVMGKIVLIR